GRPAVAALHHDLRSRGLQPGVISGIAEGSDRGTHLPSLSGRGGVARRGVPRTDGETGKRRDGADEAGGAGYSCGEAARIVGAGGAQAGRGRPSGFDREHEFWRGRCVASGGPDGALVARKLLQVHAGTLWFRCSGAIRDRRDSCYRDRSQPGVARARSRSPQEARSDEDLSENTAERKPDSTSLRSDSRSL